MLRTYRYRLYPGQDQQQSLNDILWAACWLYNRALDYRRKRWDESRHSVTYYEQAGMWRDWRNEAPGANPLRRLNMSAGQQVLRRLDGAYRQFLKGQRGRPRFQKSSRFNSVNYKPGDGAAVRGSRLYVQNAGLIQVRWHRALPEGKLKNIVLVRKSTGWYVLFQLELPQPPVEKSTHPPVGVDLGNTHALALSDGITFDSPKSLQASLRKLRLLQRSVSRKKKGGRNRHKAMRKVARLHEHIANQRLDWWHKTTRHLADTYGTIVLEDLSLTFMLQNRHLSRSAHDVGLGMFRTMLNYKAMEAGVEIVTVSPRNTSQACSGCGHIVLKDLSVRLHDCPDCGLTLDRDVNAARNVLRLGYRRWALTWEDAPSVAQEAVRL
ncbi:MAG: transposase [Anaerolineae bacterium]|nr:MAG: transposase [Anaerolineae bacterium]